MRFKGVMIDKPWNFGQVCKTIKYENCVKGKNVKSNYRPMWDQTFISLSIRGSKIEK